jgi:Stress responsive A/B Barrel Domain
MIRHTVAFRLKHAKGTRAEKEFLDAALKLAIIPGVCRFECLRQTSNKNKFDYGLSMEFETKHAYEKYNHHPDHNAFVETFWKKSVDDFIEIDYEPYEPIPFS